MNVSLSAYYELQSQSNIHFTFTDSFYSIFIKTIKYIKTKLNIYLLFLVIYNLIELGTWQPL